MNKGENSSKEGDFIATLEKKVNVLLAERKISAAKLSEGIGMTPNGYSKMWKKRSIKVETIQKIADFFNLPLSHFFIGLSDSQQYQSATGNSEVNEIREKYIQALESENELLKKLLREKND